MCLLISQLPHKIVNLISLSQTQAQLTAAATPILASTPTGTPLDIPPILSGEEEEDSGITAELGKLEAEGGGERPGSGGLPIQVDFRLTR